MPGAAASPDRLSGSFSDRVEQPAAQGPDPVAQLVRALDDEVGVERGEQTGHPVEPFGAQLDPHPALPVGHRRDGGEPGREPGPGPSGVGVHQHGHRVAPRRTGERAEDLGTRVEARRDVERPRAGAGRDDPVQAERPDLVAPHVLARRGTSAPRGRRSRRAAPCARWCVRRGSCGRGRPGAGRARPRPPGAGRRPRAADPEVSPSPRSATSSSASSRRASAAGSTRRTLAAALSAARPRPARTGLRRLDQPDQPDQHGHRLVVGEHERRQPVARGQPVAAVPAAHRRRPGSRGPAGARRSGARSVRRRRDVPRGRTTVRVPPFCRISSSASTRAVGRVTRRTVVKYRADPVRYQL